MFYVISKVFDLIVSPLAWAIALVLLSLSLARTRPRASRIAGVLAVAVLMVFGSPRVADALMLAAERPAVRTYDPAVKYDAVVLLGGMLDVGATELRHQPQYTDAADRLFAIWDVYRTGHASHVFVTGFEEAELLRDQLVAWGVPADRVFIDPTARNTRENAAETRKAVQEHGWRRVLVVTSAFHMPRALGCFRKEGLAPDALPVDYRGGRGMKGILPREHGLADSALVFRELLGRAVYRLVGYSD